MVTSHGTLALAAALRSLPSCGVTSTTVSAVSLGLPQQLSGVSRWWHGGHGKVQHNLQQQQLLPSLSVRQMAAQAQHEGSDSDVCDLSEPFAASAVSAAASTWPGSVAAAAAAVLGPCSSRSSSSSSGRRRRVPMQSHITSPFHVNEATTSAAARVSTSTVVGPSVSHNVAALVAMQAAAVPGTAAVTAAVSTTPLSAAPAQPAVLQRDAGAVDAAASRTRGGSGPFDPWDHDSWQFDPPESSSRGTSTSNRDNSSNSSSTRSSSSGNKSDASAQSQATPAATPVRSSSRSTSSSSSSGSLGEQSVAAVPTSSSSSSFSSLSSTAPAPATTTTSSSSKVSRGGNSNKPRKRKQAAAAPPPAEPAGAAAASTDALQQQQQQRQADAGPAVSGEGEVWFPQGPLLTNMAEHWNKLLTCPSAQQYTRTVSFDEFGHRYIQQLEREERARCRAMDELTSAIEKDRKHHTNYSKKGHLIKQLMARWQPLLAQAIAEEQQLVGRKDVAGAVERKDRSNYGPYLLLLEPQDLAHITLQTVLSRIATALPTKEEEDATSLLGSGTAAFGGSSSISSAFEQQNPNSGIIDDATGGKLSAAVPSVVLAEAVGRAVNNRLKYLRFKHEQHNIDRERRAAQRQLSKAEQLEAAAAWSMVQPGDALQQRLRAFTDAAGQHAQRYEAGQQRIAALEKLQGLSAAAKRAMAAAKEDTHWELDVKLKVGSALLALLLENSYLTDSKARKRSKGKAAAAPNSSSSSSSGTASAADEGVAAFKYAYVKAGLKQQAFVMASQGLVKLMLQDRHLAAQLLVKVPPMLIPPVPWTSHNKGGQLTTRHWMMRTRYSTAMQKELKEGIKNGNCAQVLDALNVLGNTAWKINPAVYAAMTKLWEQKSTAGGLPCQIPLKPPTPPPTNYRLIYEGGALSARGGQWSKAEKRGHTLACDDVRRLNRNMASLKADFLLKKQVADEYLDVSEFYYPHTLDFRGRAYPLHPSLHHLGDDICRGMLMFAHGRPLGEEGFSWLQVHLANVWGNGQDKLSFEDRRKFAEKHHGIILDVARNPLKQTWWQEAEKPWQALAACCEIAGALQHVNKSTYVSHLAVHMDGSCNGLQHYAALGRDEAGGKAVNLLPSDKPQDVYKGVAEIVARRAANDAAAGNAVAKRCMNLVDRKLVKQTVMTSVYGVTAVGARAQVESRLREKRVDMKAKATLSAENGRKTSSNDSSSGSSDALWPLALVDGSGSNGSNGLLVPGRDEYAWMDDKDMIWQASKYLADQTLDAIGEMFVSARAIMGWLADCARVVASDDAPVRWSSPLGLPIMQPYHKLPMSTVKTATQTFSVVRGSGDGSDLEGSKGLWIKARQRSAFPPNYIHSIDSTHMMMTALECSQQGIAFAGVHDSFWTHAGTVPAMNTVLRDKFMKLHGEQPGLLETLVEQLQAKHPHLEFPPIPERGDLALFRVRSSKYFFS